MAEHERRFKELYAGETGTGAFPENRLHDAYVGHVRVEKLRGIARSVLEVGAKPGWTV